MPFLFPNKLLNEGMRSAVSCQILEGSLPITFRWEKDGVGLSLPGSTSIMDGVSIRSNDEYSSTLIIDHLQFRHRGNFTCLASNSAGSASHTAELTVNGTYCKGQHFQHQVSKCLYLVLKLASSLVAGLPKGTFFAKKCRNWIFLLLNVGHSSGYSFMNIPYNFQVLIDCFHFHSASEVGAGAARCARGSGSRCCFNVRS